MKDMYRAYNRSRQYCDCKPMQTEAYNNYNNFNNMTGSCHHECTDEVTHVHQHKKEHMPIGMAYVPMQEWSEMYDACEGLYEGSAFPELNLIFCGVRGN